MKTNLFKTILSVAVVSFFLAIAFGSGDDNGSTSSSSSSSGTIKCYHCGKSFTGSYYVYSGNLGGCNLRTEKESLGFRQYCSSSCCNAANKRK